MREHRTFIVFHDKNKEPVAQGVVFWNDKAVLIWMKEGAAVSVYDSTAAMRDNVCQDSALRVIYNIHPSDRLQWEPITPATSLVPATQP